MKLSKIFLTIVAVCAMMSCAEYSYDKVSGDSTKTVSSRWKKTAFV